MRRSVAIFKLVKHDKFHGRHAARDSSCDWAGCREAGEFRAPGERSSGFDGPGKFRWFCLDHVREFNARYDFFAGMSTADILRAQSPLAGWATESRAFRLTAGIDAAPRWADFTDPLDAIAARARDRARGSPAARRAIAPLSAEEERALDTLGLTPTADRRDLRRRYSELVRQYHPDRNGGDRSREVQLRSVVEAYQRLRKAPGFV